MGENTNQRDATTDYAWMKPPSGTKDGWHVLIVRNAGAEDVEDRDVEWLHPESCGVSVSTVGGGTCVYECHTAHDLMNAGFYGMFAKDDHLEFGVYLVAPWVEEIRGFEWTEYDGGWNVVRLAVAPDA